MKTIAKSTNKTKPAFEQKHFLEPILRKDVNMKISSYHQNTFQPQRNNHRWIQVVKSDCPNRTQLASFEIPHKLQIILGNIQTC